MTKNEFLTQLNKHLLPLSVQERREIILDFEEHFSVGLAKGKTEEQICADLGDPCQCAQQYLNPAGDGKEEPQLPPDGFVSQQQPAYDPPGSPNFGTAPFMPPPTDYAAPPYSQSPAAAPYAGPPANSNKPVYVVLLILDVLFLCLPGYPMSLGLLVTFLGILIGSIAAGILLSSFLMFAFLFCLSLVFLSAGMLLFLALTWSLKALFRRINT